MRILYLAHRIPYPPDKGDKIRSFHQVEHLARDHEVDVFTLIDDPADEPHAAPLRDLVTSLEWTRLRPLPARLGSMRSLLDGRSLSERYFHRAALQRAIDRAIAARGYDVALVFSSAMAPYLDRFPGPVVVDYVDVDSAKWLAYAEQLGPSPLRWLYRREGERIRALEASWAGRAAATVVCSEREATELRSFCTPRDLRVINNGTDIDYFSPGDGPAEPPYLVFTGAMDYRANVDAVVWFCEHVYPRIRASRPDLGLRIVGSNPAPPVERLAQLDGVEVTGRVDDIRPHLRSAALAVAPLRVARGVQNKVLEALSCAVPVVCTQAALGGIPQAAGVVVEDDPERFAAETVALVEDPPRRAALARAGREFIVERFGWSRQLAELTALLVEVSSRQGSRASDESRDSPGDRTSGAMARAVEPS